MTAKTIAAITLFLTPILLRAQAPDSTYAQRLGWPKDARILIIHVDALQDQGIILTTWREMTQRRQTVK